MADMLHTYRCSRGCQSVTVTAHYVSRYERCKGCGLYAVHLFSEPVTTKEQRAIHAQGVVFNPYKPEPVPWSCVRCGEDQTGKLPHYRADGKTCTACYRAEMAPEDAEIAAGIQQRLREKAERERAEDIARAARLEQSINQSMQESK